MFCRNHRRGNECPSEYNTSTHRRRRCGEAWVIWVLPSFILHNTPACITFQCICSWWDPLGCCTPLLPNRIVSLSHPAVLTSCPFVLSGFFFSCFSDWYFLHWCQTSHAPQQCTFSFALCLSWMSQRTIIPARENSWGWGGGHLWGNPRLQGCVVPGRFLMCLK